MVVADPEHPDIVYGDTYGNGAVSNASVQRFDRRTEQTRDVDPTMAYPWAHYRITWTLPLVFSNVGPDTLYFANQRVFSTRDGGLHWTQISPDLTRKDAGVPSNLDPATAADDHHVGKRRGVIYTIAPSPLDAKVIWVGTDDGLVWRTDDGGARWHDVTPRALMPWSKVAGIELSHFKPGVAYLAIDRHRLDDDTPYIYLTRNDGRSWSRIDSNIPRGDFVNVVRQDPVQPNLLYAGTEFGIFVSFDDGAHWQSLQQNLPVTSVRDIKVKGDDLVIATHGRGIWIMDDMSALRQMSAVRPDAVTLFKPAVAIRFRSEAFPEAFAGTPMPKDEPMAANPPEGAIIDYVLPAGVRGPVTVTILDAQGHPVRRYSSLEHGPLPNPYKLDYAPEWAREPGVPSRKPGMQRFVWDLHYPRPIAPEAKGPQKDGVWAPLGTYTVMLSVMGRAYSQPLAVKPDPRVPVSEAESLRQFELAQKVELADFDASQAVDQATKLLNALDALHLHNSAARAQVAALRAKAVNISGARAYPNHTPQLSGNPPHRTDSLQALSSDFDSLEQAVDGADAAPSPDALTSFAELSQRLKETLAQWQHLESVDVPRLNAQLKAAGEQPI